MPRKEFNNKFHLEISNNSKTDGGGGYRPFCVWGDIDDY
nr:MAG TPA: hypothetical protein [Caudoviricetes sp.]